MAMLTDLLKEIIGDNQAPAGGKRGDNYMVKPPEILEGDGKASVNIMHPNELQKPPSDTIYDDSGNYSLNQNPFAGLKDMINKSRAGDNTGPGVLRQLLGNVLGGQMVPGTGTIGGDPAGVAKPDHVPGTGQDAALNPMPMAKQPQPNLTPLPQARPDYSQLTALDPNAIEQLRQSLLSDSGQLDPNNPNGLAGRMTGPNSNIDMNNQRRESQTIEDSVRGFDGSRKANIAKGNR